MSDTKTNTYGLWKQDSMVVFGTNISSLIMVAIFYTYFVYASCSDNGGAINYLFMFIFLISGSLVIANVIPRESSSEFGKILPYLNGGAVTFAILGAVFFAYMATVASAPGEKTKLGLSVVGMFIIGAAIGVNILAKDK